MCSGNKPSQQAKASLSRTGGLYFFGVSIGVLKVPKIDFALFPFS